MEKGRLYVQPQPIYNAGGEFCQPLCRGTFAVVLVPWVNAVLDAVADQGVVDAHVAMAKESFSFTRS